jgi:antitoxin MazE
MKSRIQRWGNSLAVRIPRPFARDANLREDTEVNLSLQEGRLVIEPELTLESLLEQITDENRHGETETGGAVGNEVW